MQPASKRAVPTRGRPFCFASPTPPAVGNAEPESKMVWARCSVTSATFGNACKASLELLQILFILSMNTPLTLWTISPTSVTDAAFNRFGSACRACWSHLALLGLAEQVGTEGKGEVRLVMNGDAGCSETIRAVHFQPFRPRVRTGSFLSNGLVCLNRDTHLGASRIT